MNWSIQLEFAFISFLNKKEIDIKNYRKCKICLLYLTKDSFYIGKDNYLDGKCKKCKGITLCGYLAKSKPSVIIIDGKFIECVECNKIKELKCFRKTDKSYCRKCSSCETTKRNRKKGILPLPNYEIKNGLKFCGTCLMDLPIHYFWKDEHNKNKLNNNCIKCTKAQVRKRRIKNNKPILQDVNEIKRTGIKRCTKCQKDKKVSEFYRTKSLKNGFVSHCKSCQEEKRVIYYVKNPDKKIERKLKAKQRNLINRESNSLRNKIYYQNNKEKFRKSGRKYEDKVKNTWQYKFKKRIKVAQRQALKTNKKYGSTILLLGYKLEFCRNYLLQKFIKRYGYEITWGKAFDCERFHIDHSICLEAFNLSCESAQRKAFHYTNLEILTMQDNLSKSDFLPDGRRARDLKPEEKFK